MALVGESGDTRGENKERNGQQRQAGVPVLLHGKTQAGVLVLLHGKTQAGVLVLLGRLWMAATKRVIRVLVVEDHSLVRRALKRTLEDAEDLKVVGEASDGHDAAKKAKRLRPDVVVMDFALPGMMGGAATQRILEILPETAVLILSMHAERSYVRAALDAGARGYLLKSATELELGEAVRQVAAGRHVLDSRIVLPEPPLDDVTRPLTPREMEVLRLIAHGKSNKQIAEELGIRANTVGVHRNNIMGALAIRNCAKLTLYAIGRGFVEIA